MAAIIDQAKVDEGAAAFSRGVPFSVLVQESMNAADSEKDSDMDASLSALVGYVGALCDAVRRIDTQLMLPQQ
jgi:hypothetical protein